MKNIHSNFNIQENYLSLIRMNNDNQNIEYLKLKHILKQSDISKLFNSELIKQNRKVNENSDSDIFIKGLCFTILSTSYSHLNSQESTNLRYLVNEYKELLDFFTRKINLLDLDYFHSLLFVNFFISSFKFGNFEDVSKHLLRLFGIATWVNLSDQTLNCLLTKDKSLFNKWEVLIKLSEKENLRESPYTFFFNNLLDDYLSLISNGTFNISQNNSKLKLYLKNLDLTQRTVIANKILELLVDIAAEPKINSYVVTLLKEKHVIELSHLIINKNKDLNKNSISNLINNYELVNLSEHLLEKLSWFIYHYEHNNLNITKNKYYDNISIIQGYAYEIFNENTKNKLNSQALIIKNLVNLDKRINIKSFLDVLNDDALFKIGQGVNFLPFKKDFYFNSNFNKYFGRELIYQIFYSNLESKEDIVKSVIHSSTLPTEKVLFNYYSNKNQFHFDLEHEAPLVKYSRFMNFEDFLLRSYFSLGYEMIYSMQKIVVNEIINIKPQFYCKEDFEGKYFDQAIDGTLKSFNGIFHNSLPIKGFRLLHVKPALLGEDLPAIVIGEVEYSYDTFSSNSSKYTKGINYKQHNDLIMDGEIITKRQQLIWDSMCSGDPILLVSFNKSQISQSEDSELFNISRIRGGYVSSITDSTGLRDINFSSRFDKDFLNKPITNKEEGKDKDRRMFVYLDCGMYQDDLIYSEDFSDIYSDFHLIIRLTEDINFKKFDFNKLNNSIHKVESLKQLLNTERIITNSGLENYFENKDSMNHLKRILLNEKLTFNDNLLENNDNNFNNIITNLGKLFNLTTENLKECIQNSLSSKFLNKEITEICMKAIDDQLKTTSNKKEKFNKMTVNNLQQSYLSTLFTSLINKVSLIISDCQLSNFVIISSILKLFFPSNSKKEFKNEKTLIISHSKNTLNELAKFLTIGNIIPEKNILTFNDNTGLEQNNQKTEYLTYHNDLNKINYFLNLRVSLINTVMEISKVTNINISYEVNCKVASSFLEKNILSSLQITAKFLKCFIEKTELKENKLFEIFTSKELKKQISILSYLFPNDSDSFKEVEDIEKLKYNSTSLIKYYESSILKIEECISNLEDCSNFELIRNDKERSKFIEKNLCKVYLITADQVSSLLDKNYQKVISTSKIKSTENLLKYEELLFKFNNIIFLEAEKLHSFEAFLPAKFLKINNNQYDFKNNANYKPSINRIIVFGQENSHSNLVENQELVSLVKFNQSLLDLINDTKNSSVNKLVLNKANGKSFINDNDNIFHTLEVTYNNIFNINKDSNINSFISNYLDKSSNKDWLNCLKINSIQGFEKDIQILKYNYKDKLQNDMTSKILIDEESSDLDPVDRFVLDLIPSTKRSELLKENNEEYLLKLQEESKTVINLLAYMLIKNYKLEDITILSNDYNKIDLMVKIYEVLIIAFPSLFSKVKFQDNSDNFKFPKICHYSNINSLESIDYLILDLDISVHDNYEASDKISNFNNNFNQFLKNVFNKLSQAKGLFILSGFEDLKSIGLDDDLVQTFSMSVVLENIGMPVTVKLSSEAHLNKIVSEILKIENYN